MHIAPESLLRAFAGPLLGAVPLFRHRYCPIMLWLNLAPGHSAIDMVLRAILLGCRGCSIYPDKMFALL